MTTLNGLPARRDQLKAFLLQALDEATGLILTVDGGETNARSLAIAALTAAKRELLQDEPRLLDLVIKAVPYTKDQIALHKIDRPLEEQ